jgi:hypothetical protein
MVIIQPTNIIGLYAASVEINGLVLFLIKNQDHRPTV